MCGRVGARRGPRSFLVLHTYRDGSVLSLSLAPPPSGERALIGCFDVGRTMRHPSCSARRTPSGAACADREATGASPLGCGRPCGREVLWALSAPKNERSTPCANDDRCRLGRADGSIHAATGCR